MYVTEINAYGTVSLLSRFMVAADKERWFQVPNQLFNAILYFRIRKSDENLQKDALKFFKD